MKKLFCVELPFILTILALFLSCSSTTTIAVDKESGQIVKTSIDLANAYVERGQYQKALDVYTVACENVEDYRLIYNLSLVYAYMKDYNAAYSTALHGFKTFEDKKLFLNAMSVYAEHLEDSEKVSYTYVNLLELDSENISYRKKYCNALIELGFEKEAYENAMMLWNAKCYDGETVEILYKINPAEWETVYKIFH